MTDLSKEFENIGSQNTDAEDANISNARKFLNYLKSPEGESKAMVVHGRLVDVEERLTLSVLSPSEFLIQFLEKEYIQYMRAQENEGVDYRIQEEPNYYGPYLDAVYPILKDIYIDGYLLNKENTRRLTSDEQEFASEAYMRYLHAIAFEEAKLKSKLVNSNSGGIQDLLSQLG